jgi:methenyltetrahydromethanopterin cyclohydrolase
MAAKHTLNEQALALADQMANEAEIFRVGVTHTTSGTRIIDCGITTTGGLQAGVGLTRVCLADLADVTLVPTSLLDLPCPQVEVLSDHPVLACMASQYAGWQIEVDKFFAMGSGPMRAALGKEALFHSIPGREYPSLAVGALETHKIPPDEVADHIASELGLPPDRLTLLAAPASSIAGTVQVVARSLETALHKLHELQFDLRQVLSGFGVAPLPPVASEMIKAIGRTNDAILYGGQVILWVYSEDDQLAQIGPQVPSSASSDHGAPFAEIFQRYGGDFYKIDPLLFSPALITFNNLRTGKSHTFGKLEVDILRRSFSGT